MEQKTVDQMTVEELQETLAQRLKEEKERKARERADYEKFVNNTTKRIAAQAVRMNGLLESFYKNTVESLHAMRDRLNDYGAIRANSKGGFTLRTVDGNYKVVYKYSSICDWDERSKKGEELLKDFLGDVVKKRDKELYELVVGLLEKNKEGKLEFARMQTLYAKEQLFSDPRWTESIRLFKESFQVVDSKMRLEFYRRDDENRRWVPIPLNISSL